MAAPTRMTPDSRRLRGRVAALTKSRPADDPELLALKRELREGALAAHIRRVVDQAPPLTQEQLARLATLFQPRTTHEEASAA